jgi:F0F1-type ATP synthase assembly protein I
VFTGKRMDEPAVFLRTFYWGEFNKVILTAALVIVAFVYIKPGNAAAQLAT